MTPDVNVLVFLITENCFCHITRVSFIILLSNVGILATISRLPSLGNCEKQVFLCVIWQELDKSTTCWFHLNLPQISLWGFYDLMSVYSFRDIRNLAFILRKNTVMETNMCSSVSLTISPRGVACFDNSYNVNRRSAASYGFKNYFIRIITVARLILAPQVTWQCCCISVKYIQLYWTTLSRMIQFHMWNMTPGPFFFLLSLRNFYNGKLSQSRMEALGYTCQFHNLVAWKPLL